MLYTFDVTHAEYGTFLRFDRSFPTGQDAQDYAGYLAYKHEGYTVKMFMQGDLVMTHHTG